MQNKPGAYVSSFIVVVFVLSTPFWLLEAIHPVELLPGLPLSALGAFTPALAALILTYKHNGLSAVLALLRRSLDYQHIQNKNWFLPILLINPAIAVFAYGIMSASGVSIPPPAPITLVIFLLFVAFFISALGEEIGWTGYVTELLLQRWGTIRAGLLLGSVWVIWHFIPLVQAHRSVEWIAWWSLVTLSLRMIMTWLYIQSGKSVFGVALFHAMTNLTWQLFPVQGSYYDPRIFGLVTFVFAIAMYAIERFLPSHYKTFKKFQARSSQ